MVAENYDVIVVGVGSMGSATCYQLAKRGARVLGLDQYPVPHSYGAHHGLARMIRMAYFEHPNYVPLLRRSYELWDELEHESNAHILYRTGALYIGNPGSTLISGAVRSAEEHALAYEILDVEEMGRRYPQIHMRPDQKAFFEQPAGFLIPELAVSSFVEAARRQGASINTGQEVCRWRADAKGVTVETSQNRYQAGQVVFTGGAWSGKIVRGLGVELNVTLQQQGWFEPKTPEAFQLGKLPAWYIETSGGHGYYGFPLLPDQSGMKVALHAPGRSTDIDTADRTPDPTISNEMRDYLRENLPDAAGTMLDSSVCLYTNSPDSHFIVDRHPEFEKVLVACGFSGHGFKFCPVIGEALADLALHGKSQLPIEFLRLSRFDS